MTSRGSLPYLVSRLEESAGDRGVSSDNVWRAIRGAVDPTKVVSNLAETLRISAGDTEQLLIEHGFGDLMAQVAHGSDDAIDTATEGGFVIPAGPEVAPQCLTGFSIESSPAFGEPISLAASDSKRIQLLLRSVTETISTDPFFRLYRGDVDAYFQQFMAQDAPRIEGYLKEKYPQGYPKYIVNSGIGANEQFNHLLARINNSNPARRSTWFIVSSPRQLWTLPQDATLSNTLFMEFSRSGKTEETVKLHEFTARATNRIVFANSGPLRELGVRDGNLVLTLPDEVSGRFGRNKTPILLAPMFVAGMDVRRFWQRITATINDFDLTSAGSLPVQIALFIYAHQRKNSINHIYLGVNDDALRASGHEFVQFWNEGVNRKGNDILMSSYFGLLRDSHANIEGILANAHNKLAILVLAKTADSGELPPFAQPSIQPIDSRHAGLRFGDDEWILAEAVYERLAELMPCVRITVHGRPDQDHAAMLGQLWADVTFFYSKLLNIDPGSNPEVKHVRDRSAALLGREASKRRHAKPADDEK